jgi:hypothetical protein
LSNIFRADKNWEKKITENVGYIHKIERNTKLPTSLRMEFWGCAFMSILTLGAEHWLLLIIHMCLTWQTPQWPPPLFATNSYEKGERPLQLLLTYLPTYPPTCVVVW